MFPCWIVDVRHERESGVLGHFRSIPITLTRARKVLREYEMTGTPADIRCIEELAHLHRLMIRGEMGRSEAVVCARDLGYDVS